MYICSDVVMSAFILKEDILSILVNCDLINNKKSIVIELGTCIVNMLCQLYVKYRIFKALIVEYNLAVELKSHPFRTYVYINLVFVMI